jgi:Flp pilus assembly protein TadG
MDIRSRARGQEGAAAVEFALIVGVLAMLLFGMLQFGLAFFQLQNLRAAAREGARVGALGGTVADIRTRVVNDSGMPSGTNFGSSFFVKKRATPTGAPSQVSGDTTKPCAAVNNVTPASVIAGIDLGSSQLPGGLKNIFTIDIPLLPEIKLTSADVEGEFRCES